MNVTLFKSITDNDKPYVIPLETALTRIITGSGGKPVSVKKTTEYLRREKDKSKRQSVKAENLPVVMFSGEFTVEQKSKKTGEPTFMQEDCLAKHSGLIVLDWDELPDVQSFKKYIKSIEFIYACWVSPSGGLKGLVRVSEPEKHREHFNALTKYFPNLDPSGANVNRNCYESYDPDLYVNKDAKVFTETSDKKKKKAKSSRHLEEKIAIPVAMIKGSVDGEKHSTLIRASRLAGGFVKGGTLKWDDTEKELANALAIRLGSESHPDTTSYDYYHGLTTIDDGMNYGLESPIEDVEAEESLIEREKRIKDLSEDSFIHSYDSLDENVQLFLEGRLPKGHSTGNKDLDNHFRFLESSLIYNLGNTKSGKSTLTFYLAVLSAKRLDWSWGIYTGENDTWRVYKKLMEFYIGQPYNIMLKEERERASAFIKSHFFFLDNYKTYKFDSIVDYATKLVRDHNISYFLLDPLNALHKNTNDSHREDYENVGEAFAFTKREKCGLWINMHPRSDAARERKGATQRKPYPADAEGGGKFSYRADLFTTMHRDINGSERAPNIAEFHIELVREEELGCSPTLADKPLEFEFMDNSCGYLFVEQSDKRVDLMNPRVGSSL